MTGTTEGPGWPHDPTAAPPTEDGTVTLDESSEELEPEVDGKPKRRGRAKKTDK